MNHGHMLGWLRKWARIAIGIAISAVVWGGLLLLINGSPKAAQADPGEWFAAIGGSGAGCTQTNPCRLATAMDHASDGDTVYVAPGTYTGTAAAVITITKSITLFGGWDGSAIAPPVRDPGTYPTVLDGEHARRGVFISGDITPTLDGFVIIRGNASTAATDPGYGGGIYSSGATPIISHNVITGNVAYTHTSGWGYGGGVYIRGDYSMPVMATLHGNIIANNSATTVYRGKGGGIAVEYGNDVIISDNTLRSNIAGAAKNGMGGGVHLVLSSAIVSNNVIQGNQAAPAMAGFGGGLNAEYGDIALDSNSFTDNTAVYGTVTFLNNPNVTLTNNIIARNPAGGVFFRGSSSSPIIGFLAHNTIAENNGEGVYAGWYDTGDITLTLINNIIVSHTTGIYAYPLAPNLITATHTLFYGNDADTDGASIASTSEMTGSAPLFVSPAKWDYHLQADSPAIDAGAPLPWLTDDIDGDPRPWPIGGAYDIGADEAKPEQVYLPLVFRSSG